MSTLLTSIQMKDVIGKMLPNELLSKKSNDTVEPVEIQKPEVMSPGFQDNPSEERHDLRSSPPDPIQSKTSMPPIVSPLPNLNKERDDMFEEGFIKLPRSLLKDPQWNELRLKYQKVFLTILTHVAFTPRTYSIQGNLIDILPGQICTSIRNLVDLCNQNVRFKVDLVDKNIVERAVSVLMKIRYLRHEVRHGKCVFTVSFLESYEMQEELKKTQTETQPRHDRDINEERKERRDIKETIDSARDPVSSSDSIFDSSLLNLENKKQEQAPPPTPSVFTPQQDRQTSQFTQEQQKHYEILWNFCVKKGFTEPKTRCGKPGLKEKDIVQWMQKYPAKDIFECLKIVEGTTVKNSYGGLITFMLKGRISQKKDNVQINNEFLEDLRRKNIDLRHLQETKQYVTDTVKHADYQKNSDPETFKDMILRSLEMAKNYGQQPEVHQESEEYEEAYY